MTTTKKKVTRKAASKKEEHFIILDRDLDGADFTILLDREFNSALSTREQVQEYLDAHIEGHDDMGEHRVYKVTHVPLKVTKPIPGKVSF